jgi:hypothetical protein
MSAIIDIAEAVVYEINNADVLPSGVNAQRHYVPTFELKDMDTLHVSVVPRGVSIQTMNRAYFQHDVQIDIGIQQRFKDDQQLTLDVLMQQVEQISNLLTGKRLAELPAAVWLRTENDPIYAPEHMDRLRQFTSVLTLTYRVTRPGNPGSPGGNPA